MRDSLRINFVGDLCFQGVKPEVFEIEEEIIEQLKQSSINVANLETVLTFSTSSAPGHLWPLKAEPRTNPILDLFDVFSLANNHILDYSRKGLEDTIVFLSTEGKGYFGAGLNEEQAWEPLCIEVDHFKIAFMGFTRWDNARGPKCGTTPQNFPLLAKTIRNLKKKEYFVVVCPHWNYEYVDYPAPYERTLAKKAIEAGADLIVGSHPHCMQGIEIYHGRHIFHSLGNFIFLHEFDHPIFHSPELRAQRYKLFETAILTVDIQKDLTYHANLLPMYTTRNGIRRMDEAKEKEFREKLDRLSQVFENEKLYRKMFYSHSDLIICTTMKALSGVSKRNSTFVSLLKRLPKIQRQDVYIKLHSMFGLGSNVGH